MNTKHAWTKKEEERRERLNDGNNNGQLRIAMPPRLAHAKPVWANDPELTLNLQIIIKMKSIPFLSYLTHFNSRLHF